jgi:hypothetical protein
VYGTNPCGLVNINWGDGVGWYHAVPQLPYSYGYAWAAPGTYTITAFGGGNCSGQASTTITVTGAEPQTEPVAAADAGRGVASRAGRFEVGDVAVDRRLIRTVVDAVERVGT